MIPIVGLLLQFAPDLINLFVGKKAGDAATVVSNAAKQIFGTDNPVAVQRMITDNPTMAQAFVDATKIDLEKIRLEMEDVQSARAQTVALVTAGSPIGFTAPAISILVIIGYFTLITMLFFVERTWDERTSNLLNILFGVLSTSFVQVVNYWLGSSSGSKRNADTVRALATEGAVTAGSK